MNMVESKKSEYYFGSDSQVLEVGQDEDEWEGSFLDDTLLALLSPHLDPFWLDVWLQVKYFSPSLTFSLQYSDYLQYDELVANVYSSDMIEESVPCLNDLQRPFWQYDVTTANRLGWDWSGDTEVHVFQLWAKDIKDVCVACILKWGKYGFTSYTSNTWYTTIGKPWEQFWEESVSGENNLPKLNGNTGEIASPISSGNERVSIARIGTSNTFYVVEYLTS